MKMLVCKWWDNKFWIIQAALAINVFYLFYPGKMRFISSCTSAPRPGGCLGEESQNKWLIIVMDFHLHGLTYEEKRFFVLCAASLEKRITPVSLEQLLKWNITHHFFPLEQKSLHPHYSFYKLFICSISFIHIFISAFHPAWIGGRLPLLYLFSIINFYYRIGNVFYPVFSVFSLELIKYGQQDVKLYVCRLLFNARIWHPLILKNRYILVQFLFISVSRMAFLPPSICSPRLFISASSSHISGLCPLVFSSRPRIDIRTHSAAAGKILIVLWARK